MSTATVGGNQVASNQVSQIKSSCFLDIIYIDQNGWLNTSLDYFKTATGLGQLPFTGTVGQPYSLSAVEIQGEMDIKAQETRRLQ